MAQINQNLPKNRIKKINEIWRKLLTIFDSVLSVRWAACSLVLVHCIVVLADHFVTVFTEYFVQLELVRVFLSALLLVLIMISGNFWPLFVMKIAKFTFEIFLCSFAIRSIFLCFSWLISLWSSLLNLLLNLHGQFLLTLALWL